MYASKLQGIILALEITKKPANKIIAERKWLFI
jgi:hypothetical protein